MTKPATTPKAQPPPAEPKTRPRRRWLRRTLIASQVALGLVLGLWGTEYMFSERAQGAFPHVNFYVPDAELGVRLEPGAAMNFRLGNNPLTTIHVNTSGYRGPEWSEPVRDAKPSEGEVLVLGDSQVFGLGVNDDETFSARLAEHTGRSVINAGVPTYGPQEYLAITDELLAKRRPQTVVYVLNFLNDPFELERPNNERHAVWDGWAVRIESAPEPGTTTHFPGRRWLMSKSHAMYAARRWLYERGKAELPDHANFGFPSEGDWQDLIGSGAVSQAKAQAQTQEAKQALASKRDQLNSLGEKFSKNRSELDSLISQASDYEWGRNEPRLAKGRPGDIVSNRYSEASRDILVTAKIIRAASRARDKYLQKLLSQEAKQGKSKAKSLLESEAKLKAQRDTLRQEIAAGRVTFENQPSVFEPHLAELAELCEQHGAELVVVALPVDVQVSADEWGKYGVDPVAEGIDMEPSLALLDDLIASAHRVGARGLDATPALRDAGPGAFLEGDIHMTAKGHAALAQALAQTLKQPPPLVMPKPGLPPGRTLIPGYNDWPVREKFVRGSSKAGCATHLVGEWLKVQCTKVRPRVKPPSGVEVVGDKTNETLTLVTPDSVSIVTPLAPGQPATIRFYWEDQVRDLNITWPAGDDGKAKFAAEFVDVADQPGRPLVVDKIGAKMCACHKDVHDERWSEDIQESGTVYRTHSVCRGVWGAPHPQCWASYASDCEKLLACAQGDPLVTPPCPEGQVHATATHACFAVCDQAHPCDAGTCTPYHGGSICR